MLLGPYCVNLMPQVSWQVYLVPCGPRGALLPPSYFPSITLPSSDLWWQCLIQTSCGSASLGPPVAVTPSELQ